LDASPRRLWVLAALLVGVGYFLIGWLFALPGSHAQAWRLAAWLVSACVAAAHIGYEHYRLRSSPRFTALHAASAVAIGAFLLAVAGMLHSFWTPAGFRLAWLLALVLWPVFTAVPAFLGALLVAILLSRFPRTAHG
jgi:hypothetical protein